MRRRPICSSVTTVLTSCQSHQHPEIEIDHKQLNCKCCGSSLTSYCKSCYSSNNCYTKQPTKLSSNGIYSKCSMNSSNWCKSSSYYVKCGSKCGSSCKSCNSATTSCGSASKSYSSNGTTCTSTSKAYSCSSNSKPFTSSGNSCGSNSKSFNSTGNSCGSNSKTLNATGNSCSSNSKSLNSTGNACGSNSKTLNSTGNSCGSNSKTLNSTGNSCSSNSKSLNSTGNSCGSNSKSLTASGNSCGSSSKSYTSTGNSCSLNSKSYGTCSGKSCGSDYLKDDSSYSSRWPMYTIVALVSVVCYLNGLSGNFVHDDIPAVTLNKDVLAVNPIGHMFLNDFWGTPMADINSHKSYRPLTTLTFRANYVVFGLRPVWFHATNIALHSAACVLFTRVCLLVAGLRPGFATLAGLLFAAHPIHTEAVTGIVGRADVLACVFFLISLLAYHGNSNGKNQICTSVILGGLSMLAKETGVTVFMLNLAYDFYRCWPFLKRSLVEVRWNEETYQFARRAGRVLMSLGVLLAVRLALLQGSLPKFSQQDNPTAFHPSLYVRLLTFCYLAAFNWWLLLCPVTLSHDWQMGSVPLLTSISDSRNLVTCLFFGCALLIAYRCIADFEQQRHMPLVLGFLLLVLPFLPATNLVVTVGFVIAERVLYIPSLGSVILTVYGMQLLWAVYVKHRQTFLCCVVILLTCSSIRTVARNRDWRSRESLLRAGLQTLPQNAKMHYNFANFLRDSSRIELAMSHYNKALELWPAYASAHNNLGTLVSNDIDAEEHFLLAIKYSPDHVNAHYNLGQLYRKVNKTDESIQMLERCIALEPAYTPAYLALARIRGSNNPGSGQLLKHVVQLHPKNPNHLTLYADWLRGQGRNLEAIIYYWRALSSSGAHRGAVGGICRALRSLGQRSRVLQLLARWQLIERALRGEPPPFIGLHVFLHSYHLHAELKNKAKEYDSCSCTVCTQNCKKEPKPSKPTPETRWPTSNKSQTTSRTTSPSPCNKTERSQRCTSQSRLVKLNRNRLLQKSKSAQLLLHNLLDTV